MRTTQQSSPLDCSSASVDDRDPLEQLVSQFIALQRTGDAPSIDEFAKRHPDLSDTVRELFPTIVAMEQLRNSKGQRRADGRVCLGAANPSSLGEYQIVEEIGRGGMGIVYEAEHRLLGRRVAVKVLPRGALQSPTGLNQFRHEAETMARLHHPNIVPVHGIGEQDGFHYYVMQRIDGVGLDQYAASSTRRTDSSPPVERLDPTEVAAIGCQVASALAYAHLHGTLHRDIKPSNLLLDQEQKVWVTDFGLAQPLTTGGSTPVVGTLRYMAPEQFHGHADPRSDIYSLGITLYELLTQQPAFSAKSPKELRQRIQSGQYPPPRSLRPEIPRPLETVICKAMAVSPDQRHPTADTLATELGRSLPRPPLPLPSSPSLLPTPSPRPSPSASSAPLRPLRLHPFT